MTEISIKNSTILLLHKAMHKVYYEMKGARTFSRSYTQSDYTCFKEQMAAMSLYDLGDRYFKERTFGCKYLDL